MNMLLVGYDLNKTGQDYKNLIEFLESHGTYWHHLDSTWLVKTAKSAKELRDELVDGYIDSNDEVLVVDISGDAAAWWGFNDRGSEWLKNNL